MISLNPQHGSLWQYRGWSSWNPRIASGSNRCWPIRHALIPVGGGDGPHQKWMSRGNNYPRKLLSNMPRKKGPFQKTSSLPTTTFQGHVSFENMSVQDHHAPSKPPCPWRQTSPNQRPTNLATAMKSWKEASTVVVGESGWTMPLRNHALSMYIYI